MSAKWDRFWDMCRPAPRAFTVPADAMKASMGSGYRYYGNDENYQRLMSEARAAREVPNRLHGAAINAEGDAI